MSRTIAVDDSIFCVSYIYCLTAVSQSYPWITVDNDNMVGLELQFRKIKLGLIYLITWPINERWNTSHPRKFNTSHHQSFRRLQYVEKHCVGVSQLNQLVRSSQQFKFHTINVSIINIYPYHTNTKFVAWFIPGVKFNLHLEMGTSWYFLWKLKYFGILKWKKGLFNIPQSGHESV